MDLYAYNIYLRFQSMLQWLDLTEKLPSLIDNSWNSIKGKDCTLPEPECGNMLKEPSLVHEVTDTNSRILSGMRHLMSASLPSDTYTSSVLTSYRWLMTANKVKCAYWNFTSQFMTILFIYYCTNEGRRQRMQKYWNWKV
jgi:hypothetical protein